MTLKEVQDKIKYLKVTKFCHQEEFVIRTEKGTMVLHYKNGNYQSILIDGKEEEKAYLKSLLNL